MDVAAPIASVFAAVGLSAAAGLNLDPAYLAARMREIAPAMRDSARPQGSPLRRTPNPA